MLVVDTNVIAYLLLPGVRTEAARALYRRDPSWHAPVLWRSEWRNVLATYLRAGELRLADATTLCAEAESLMTGGEHLVDSAEVLSLAASSRCSAYDCEFVAVARAIGVPLVTTDRQLLAAFPEVAVPLGEDAPGG